MDSQTVVIVVLALVAAALVFLALVVRGQARRGDSGEAGRLAAERERLVAELDAAREAGRAQTHELGSLNGRMSGLETALEEARARATTLESRLEQAQARLAELDSELSSARANLEHAGRANTQMRGFLDDAQVKLSGAFTELAGKVFDEKGQQFEKNIRHATGQSRTDIEQLLKPFAERIKDFRERVDTLYSDEAKERAQLAGAVSELKGLNQDMADQAHALTRALKGNAKIRGDWGELMLESVLRGSGLEEGVHYERQKSARDDDGARLQPDIVVNLPDERCVVVDSKVNLIAWQEAMNADTPEAQDEAMRRHAAGLRQHMRDLGEKNYPRAIGAHALEVTIAFVPIEGALSAALGSDPHLQGEAFDKRIVFASPNTLMALLRVIERLWTRDKVQRKALEISDSGGKVLDALVGFLSEFELVGKRLDDAEKAYAKARSRLHESNQAVIPRARRLVELGAKGRRALPDELKAGADEEELTDAAPVRQLLGAALEGDGEREG